MGHFRNEYGQDIELERVWMKENGSNLILNGNLWKYSYVRALLHL